MDEIRGFTPQIENRDELRDCREIDSNSIHFDCHVKIKKSGRLLRFLSHSIWDGMHCPDPSRLVVISKLTQVDELRAVRSKLCGNIITAKDLSHAKLRNLESYTMEPTLPLTSSLPN